MCQLQTTSPWQVDTHNSRGGKTFSTEGHIEDFIATAAACSYDIKKFHMSCHKMKVTVFTSG